MAFPQFVLQLPDWIEGFLPSLQTVYESVQDRMRLAVELARQNVKRGTGGPFGAAVFDMQQHTLLAPGVNLVVPLHSSFMHAEIVALVTAQQIVGHFDLGGAGIGPYELVTSVEPCAMCLGAVPWSGVRRVVCGARDGDARSIGFDEGPKPADWQAALRSRGIETIRDVCRDEAISVLDAYLQSEGQIYNARKDGKA